MEQRVEAEICDDRAIIKYDIDGTFEYAELDIYGDDWYYPRSLSRALHRPTHPKERIRYMRSLAVAVPI